MPQLNAFIARSFLPEDERRLKSVLHFLETFEKMGFICRHAEAAEVQSVSAKVRALIDKSDVFVGIFTRRHPIYVPPVGVSGAWKVLRGVMPTANSWSAPAWVLQESGYALQRLGPTRLILLREPDVEIPGLQGDLEYVPFIPEKPADVFSKLSEMIHGLLAEASGIEVRTLVSERLVESKVASEPTPAEAPPEPPKEEVESDFLSTYIRLADATDGRDYEGLSQAWTDGIVLIEQGKSEMDRLAWDCFYFEARFRAGASDGLEGLKGLIVRDPKRPEPVVALARCLKLSEEYQDSARLYLKAAGLAKELARPGHLLEAAGAFRAAKQYQQGKDAAREALRIAKGQERTEALSELYQLYKASDETYLAFATAEAALQENPQVGIRFGLGLDYHRHDLADLALLHFKFLYDHDNTDAPTLHNFALMYADCNLPISAVKRYKAAIELGETLSAANLGFIYLDAGIADDAQVMIQKAMTVESHPRRVEKCLAAIIERTEDEEAKEKELLHSARKKRDFLVQMGRASYAPTPALQGRWRFPFGEMILMLNGQTVSGEVEVKTEQSAYSGFFNFSSDVGSTETKIERIESYSIQGTFTGAVCQFNLTVTDNTLRALPAMNALSSLYGTAGTSKSGFFMFEADGMTGLYAELTDQKLGEPQPISRVG
jgi:tetratricopeptide (TPR) repeat protein